MSQPDEVGPSALNFPEAPVPLAGRSSIKEMRLGCYITGSGGFLGGLNGIIAGLTRNGWGAFAGFILVVALVVAGGVVFTRGLKKRKLELGRGYTVDVDIAYRRPELWAFDVRTLRPVLAPWVRPARVP